MGDLELELVIPSTTLATRDSVAKTPYFPETNSCLALLPGEKSRSGRNPGSDDIGKVATIPNEFLESQ
jgi:hypothetical protein